MTFVRDRTNEELDAAIASWEAHVAEWDKCGGTFFVRGTTDITCECECEDSTVCSGVWDGDTWHWISYGPKKATSR
jgi:hypothetical protein